MRRQTFAILLVALSARLLILWFVAERYPHRWLYSRGIELGTLAQSLLAGQGLSSPFGGSTGPSALLAPGYPAVIALVFRIFGPFTFAAAIAVMVMQIFFSVMTVVLIMHVAQRCFDRRTAHVAGAFWAVSLPLLWMPTIFWETCLSTLLLVGMIALGLRCEERPSTFLWAAMGGYCGLAALVNPALLLSLLALTGMGGVADAGETSIFASAGVTRSAAGVRSLAYPECTRAGCLHPAAKHSGIGIVDGQSCRGDGVSG